MELDFTNTSQKITVSEFAANSSADLDLTVLAGKRGLEKREISSSRIQKLGLALAGFTHYIHEGRIQIVGQSEIGYLNQLESGKRVEAIRNLDLKEISCILITNSLIPPDELIQVAELESLPILCTKSVSSKAISEVTRFLQDLLAPRITLHGVMMGVYGVGVLILGESGIGKSECALDLITRGHSLISDDSVVIKKIDGRLEGTSPEITCEHLEIRGLGILNIRDLFGVSSVSYSKNIELIIELKQWNDSEDIERLGMEIKEENFLGVGIKKFSLPVSVGRNLSTLVETAIRLYLTNTSGVNAAHKLFEKHSEMLRANQAKTADR